MLQLKNQIYQIQILMDPISNIPIYSNVNSIEIKKYKNQ